MKATFNGVLQLSVLDGWWAEGYDGTNGWAIPGDGDEDPDVADARDAELFYDLLEHEVIPLFHDRDEHGVPQRLVRPDQARRSSRARRAFTRDAHGQRLRRADLPGRLGCGARSATARSTT